MRGQFLRYAILPLTRGIRLSRQTALTITTGPRHRIATL